METNPDIDIHELGGYCPVQGTGTVQVGFGAPHWWYFRARGESWALELWPAPPEHPMELPDGDPIWFVKAVWTDDPYAAGYMGLDEAERLIRWALGEWVAGDPGGVLTSYGPMTREHWHTSTPAATAWAIGTFRRR